LYFCIFVFCILWFSENPSGVGMNSIYDFDFESEQILWKLIANMQRKESWEDENQWGFKCGDKNKVKPRFALSLFGLERKFVTFTY